MRMDDLKSKLLSLSDQDLRKYLETCEGYDGTPITPSTRILLIRKLTRSLLKTVTADDQQNCAPHIDKISSKYSEDSPTNSTHLPSDESSAAQVNTKQIYYGVHTPGKSESHHQIFSEKKDVIKFMKEYPEARFKVFHNWSDAEEFTKVGVGDLVDTRNMSVADKTDEAAKVITGEKTSSFKAPKPQELVQLRKTIEKGDVDKFLEIVWKNPRYLVSSGDTPTILQEGSRYNALHVASKTGNAAMCEAILETVSNPSFIRLLYCGNDESTNSENKERTQGSHIDDQTVLNCVAYLLDLYLNTPEKGRNETPLHFASKFGKVDAVKVLVSYPVCDRTRPNKLGETPEDLICSRSNNDNKSDAKKICQLIKDKYYVPVMRPLDLSHQASVGDPFSPEKAPLSTPESRKDPTSPLHEINAYAGPMSYDEALEFSKKLKSPPKGMNGKYPLGAFSPIPRGLSSPSSCSSSPLRLCDPDRGLEREARELANELDIGWMEYWPFLGAFANFSTKEGMKILENFFCQKLQDTYKLKRLNEESIDGEELSRNAENLTAKSSPEENSNKVFVEEKTPISELCEAMQSCTLSSGGKNDNFLQKTVCGPSNLMEQYSGASPSPIQYVERSCRVFARRISDSIIREAHKGSKKIASHCIGPEIHHLRRLVSSFKEDNRFSSIDFSHMHSRISGIVADGILESVSSSNAEKIAHAMESIPTTSTYINSSSDDEDDRYLEKDCDSRAAGREWRIRMRRSLHKVEDYGYEEIGHVKCLMTLIKEALEKAKQVSASPLKSLEDNEHIKSIWAETKSCPCSWSYTGSLHHNKASTRASMAAVSRRLSFEHPPVCESPSSNISQDIHHNEFTVEGNDRETDSDEIFFTPPSSPRIISKQVSCSDDEDDIMEDTEELIGIFVDGDHPTKLDLDVLHALEGAGTIDPKEFPFIYQWKNLVLTHSAEERSRWMSPFAPRWRRQIGLSGNLVNRTSRNAASSPSYLSKIHHSLFCEKSYNLF
ncbi:hypothetical protein J437_LFUL004519 [Ladona fulva]|uniref:LEM domain-containing protein n=1 Tax=Ladona fulva TaxID=123851 RepID=A0A8K0KA70_LADFU|nr:hypothetical protein J437_LFUL004519 [Ladona fulva]